MRVLISLHPCQHFSFKKNYNHHSGYKFREFCCKEKQRIGLVAREGGSIKVFLFLFFILRWDIL